MKVLKKITAVLLAILFLFSPVAALPLSFEGFAASVPQLITTVSSQTVSQGDTVTVTVSLDQTVNSMGFGLEFVSAYDHDVFEWVSGEWCETIGSKAALQHANPGAHAVYATMEAFDVSGEIFSFVLKVKGEPSCLPYEIKVTTSDLLETTSVGTAVSAEHTYDNACDAECNVCGSTNGNAGHTYDNVRDADCNVCGAVREIPDNVYAVRPGDTFAVTVALTNDAPLSTRGFGIDFLDAYDKNVFEWVEGSWCETILDNALMQTVNPGKEGAFAVLNAFELSGEIFTLVLKAKGDAALGDYAINVDLRGLDGARLATTVVTIHECSPAESFEMDAVAHWSVCSTYGCAREINRAEHGYDNACDPDCNACGYTRTITHDYSVQDKDAESHWMKCSVCGAINEATVAPHGNDNACDPDCNACGFTRTITHDYSVQDKDAESHWMKCSVCGAIDEATVAPHAYDNACDPECNACGAVREIQHDFTVQDKDDKNHWMKCSVCGAIDEATVVPHMYDNACDPDCNACGFTRVPADHVYDGVCDSDCNVCAATRTAPHDYTVQDKDETNHWMKCSLCGVADETTVSAHVYDNACDVDCNVCAQTRPVPDHVYDDPTDLTCNECGFERTLYVIGDVDGSGVVDMDDAIYLLFYCSFPDDYPVHQPANFDNAGEVDMDDAIYLLFFCSFPEDYPLFPGAEAPDYSPIADKNGTWVAEYKNGEEMNQLSLILCGEELIFSVGYGTPLSKLDEAFQKELRDSGEVTICNGEEYYFGRGDGDGLALVEESETVNVTDLLGKMLVLNRTSEDQLTVSETVENYGGFYTVPAGLVFTFIVE